MKALFEYKEKADRRAQADQRAWQAGKDLLAAKAKVNNWPEQIFWAEHDKGEN